MILNKNLLVSALRDNLRKRTFHAIVTECFINGLPLHVEELTSEEKTALTKYSNKVMDQLDAWHSLESAIVSHKGKQQAFLFGLYETCNEIATEAANRIANEVDCKDPDANLKDIVDKASFTEDEQNRFVAKANTMDLETVSKVIKEKTLSVIKDEQEQYERDEALNDELKDALSESKDFSETTTEAYMDLILEKGDPRHHVSLFSKLQDAAMEMMEVTKVANGSDMIPIVERVTFEAFLPDLRKQNTDFNAWCEAYSKVANEEVCTVEKENRPKMATLVSMIVYTVIETLKTMNVYNPSQEDIKKFVSAPSSGRKVEEAALDSLIEKAMEKTMLYKTLDFSKKNSNDLANILSELKQIVGLLNTQVINGDDEATNGDGSTVDLITRIETQIDNIENVLAERSTQEPTSESVSYFTTIAKEGDIAQFNKISSLFGKNPNVSEIHLRVDTDSIGSVVDVECANESGNIVKRSFMEIQAAVESSSYVEYLKSAYEKSKLHDTEKPVYIISKDGKGTKIQL